MKMHYIIYFNLFLGGLCFAATVETPAQVSSAVLAYAVENFYKKNNDIPKSLELLFNNVDKLDALERRMGAKINERFSQFTDYKITDSKYGVLVLITRDRVMEDRRETIGRYVVWLKEGKAQHRWEPEEKMQKLFRNAGLTLEAGKIWKQPDVKHFSLPLITRPPDPDRSDPELGNNQRSSRDSTSVSVNPRNQEHFNEFKKDVVDNKRNGKVQWIAGVILLAVAASGLLWMLLKRRK